MALTPSTMLPLGTRAPDFRLPDAVSGDEVSLSDFASAKALVVMFICNHCPFVVHVKDGLAKLGADYADNGDVALVAISANDVTTHPQDAPDKMKTFAEANGFRFPYLYDESQAVAKRYTAACTPDFFLFDADRKLVYRGQFDGARPSNDVPVTGEDLRRAIDHLLAGQSIEDDQKPSMG
ncbi:MAG: thioredoxin family protein [Planctomycetota bacterium]